MTGLDVVGVKHLSKALDTLLSIGLPRERFRVVLNRADSKVGLDAADVERVMKIQVDAMIPSSRLVPTSLNKGRPVVLDEPTSEVSVGVRNLAAKFMRRPGTELQEPMGSAKKKFRLFSKSGGGTPMSLADRLAKAQQRDRLSEVRARVQERLVEVLGPRLYDSTLSDTELEGLVTSACASCSTRRRHRSPRRRSSSSSVRSATASWASARWSRSCVTRRSPRSW